MARDIKKQILRHIALAQVCSDSGKGIYPEGSLNNLSGSKMASRDGYDSKTYHIKEAIELLKKIPPCGIIWSVVKAPDQNGYSSVLVYFTVSAGVVPGVNERHQISFHNPYYSSNELYKYIGKGSRTRWTKNIGESKWFASQIANWLVNS